MKEMDSIMNVRAFLVVPVALAVGVLAGCGQTEGESSTKRGSTQLRLPSTAVCSSPAWIRERAPEGLCRNEIEKKVDDDLSPLSGK